MNAWPFVIAAYALVVAATVVTILWSWRQMASAEARADAVTHR